MTGKVIIKDAVDPSKSNSKGSVNQIALPPDLDITFADSLNSLDFVFILVGLVSLPDLLREGHSVVIKGFVEQITNETEEDKLDEIKEVKSDEFIKDKSAKSVTIKTRDREYHFSANAAIECIPTNAAIECIPTNDAIEWNITKSLEKLWRSLVKSSRVGKSCG